MVTGELTDDQKTQWRRFRRELRASGITMVNGRDEVRFRLTFSCGIPGADFVYHFAADVDAIEDAGGEYQMLRTLCISEALRLTRQAARTTVRLNGQSRRVWRNGTRQKRQSEVKFAETLIEKQQPDGLFVRVTYPRSGASDDRWP